MWYEEDSSIKHAAIKWASTLTDRQMDKGDYRAVYHSWKSENLGSFL